MVSDPLILSTTCPVNSWQARPLIQCTGRLLCEVKPGSKAASSVTEFIRRRFFQAYGAQPELTVRRLLVLTTRQGALLAAVGVRNASNERLFLEDYIDTPVETVIPVETGETRVRRGEVVEIAHLAGVEAGVSRHLFAGLTLWLHSLGYQWIAFTGTDQLRNSFRRLGIVAHVIAPADPTRLPDGARGWGSYYDHHPMVMAVNVLEGLQALEKSGLLRRARWLTRASGQGGCYEHIA